MKNFDKILNKKPLLKFKLKGLINSSGKNNSGKIVCRHKGGGHKKVYRIIGSKNIPDFVGIVTSVEYDPNRTANIISIYNLNKKCHYIYQIAPKYIKIGDIIKVGSNANINLGHSLQLAKIPEGSFIHNIDNKFSKAAGMFSQLIEKNQHNCKIKLASGTLKTVSSYLVATIGVVSNDSNLSRTFKKAGRSRWLNKRPTVRGVAMNPVDHPHGGGEGKKSGKRLTPWGKHN